VQVDEPALAAVLDARVPTASGFGRHRAVDHPEASTALGWVLAAVEEAGAEPWVHSCAPGTPLGLLVGAGAAGLSVDPGVLVAADLDALAEAAEAGRTLALGAVPALPPIDPPTDRQVADGVLRLLDLLGLDPDGLADRLVLTPTCGLAEADPSWSRTAHTVLARAARNLASG
jgi:hypothetical protein